MDQQKSVILLEENFALRQNLTQVSQMFNALSEEYNTLMEAIIKKDQKKIDQIIAENRKKRLAAVETEQKKLDELRKTLQS